MRKILLNENQFKRLIELLKEQDEDDEYYRISPKDYKTLIRKGYYQSEVTMVKKFKGKPLYITGDLDLSDMPEMTSLGNVAVVDGRLTISDTKISDISKTEVKGYVFDWGTPIQKRRIAREEQEKKELAQERKEDGEWDLDNPDIDEKGLMANALYLYLVNKGELDEMDEDTKEEIESLKERLEELNTRYEDVDGVLEPEEVSPLADEISELEDEIYDLTNDITDVYNIIPIRYEYYNMSKFEVVGHRGKEYAVGTMTDAENSAIDYMKSLLDDIGLEGINLRRYVDEDQVRNEMREYYEDSIRDSPESWFDSDDFELTEEQEERKEQLENYISQLEEQQSNLEDEIEDPDEYSKKYDEIQELIDNAQEELDGIEPDTEPTEEMIEDKVESLVDSEDPIDYLTNMGSDLKDYVDIDEIAEDMADEDGIGILSNYNGQYDEQTVTTSNGQRYSFIVMRIE
jgi:predicted RNase H-like nuclease (RuvC/YqgF family)